MTTGVFSQTVVNIDSWGTSMWYFEIGEDQYLIQQIENYENRNILKYHSEKRFDDDGGLGTEPLEHSREEFLWINI